MIRTYRCEVTNQQISDLHQRLDLTRWPDQLTDAEWDFGVEKTYLQELVHYWRHHFDWREQESRFNELPHYMVNLEGVDLHFIHQPSTHENARPLILTHGWPGSFLEFLDVIPRLTQPEKFGGRPEDAFHVVCPSIAGFGFSATSPEVGVMHFGSVAQRHIKLMKLLGYRDYIAQGGDMGSPISRIMAVLDPEQCKGLHLNLLIQPPPEGVDNPESLILDAEKHRMQHAQQHQLEGAAYQMLQATRPQTLAYALQDSPVGWCAWVTEKFATWADCNLEIRNVMSWDDLLTNISLYWFTDTIASSLRFYRQNAFAGQSGQFSFDPVTVPTGVAVYPKEIFQTPRAWAEHSLPIVHWTETEQGGHFPAVERPQFFSEDLWKFKATIAGIA